MREEEAAIIITCFVCAIGGGLAFYGMWQKQRKEERKERHELLREALQHPQLDDLTRAELLRTIARQPDPSVPRLFGWVRTLWFAAGWLMFVGGGGALLLDAIGMIRTDDDVAAGFAIAGFALLSLPLGLRELTRRDNAAAGQRQA
jgi:hypothetical protein